MKDLLERFCDKIGDWDITFKDACAKISITFPSIRDKSSGKLVPVLFSFPLEIQERISNIANETVRQYIPPLDDFQLALCDNTTKFQILDRIRSKEHAIISNGGRSFRDELRFKFRRIMKELLDHLKKGEKAGLMRHSEDCDTKFYKTGPTGFVCNCNWKEWQLKLDQLIIAEKKNIDPTLAVIKIEIPIRNPILNTPENRERLEGQIAGYLKNLYLYPTNKLKEYSKLHGIP